ncbi:MAG: LamG-like jellyroll fold domain-containing protein, partial [Planctomycetota bacterium]
NEDVVFYKNRQSRSKGAAPVPDRSDNNITIGDNPGPWDEYFAGRIDDVRVYNYALSDGEIGDICQGGRPGSKGD